MQAADGVLVLGGAGAQNQCHAVIAEHSSHRGRRRVHEVEQRLRTCEFDLGEPGPAAPDHHVSHLDLPVGRFAVAHRIGGQHLAECLRGPVRVSQRHPGGTQHRRRLVDEIPKVRAGDPHALAALTAHGVDEVGGEHAFARSHDDLVKHSAGNGDHVQRENVAVCGGQPDCDAGERAGAVAEFDAHAPGRRHVLQGSRKLLP
ncbi:hypothetical protein [Lentzea indica]|uniref:hypothetical protein n=1 Tax=Lentzea indica TaxID=2604800 RepID=UPI001FE79486|nr:hypothetical protein [Lentzea indica]